MIPLALAALVFASPALAGTSTTVETVLRDSAAGGLHWRLMTSNGPVHVWRPRLYDRDTAGIMIYVHGYYTSVDQAWSEQDLAEKFKSCKRNALFIVPEAPASDDEAVLWKELPRLLVQVRHLTRHRLPSGPVSVLAFSGGFRTVVDWLHASRLDQIILLDALYSNEDDFAGWLLHRHGRGRGNKLLIVASETAPRADAFVRRFRSVVARGAIPEHAFELNRAERNAEVLYMRTTVEHLALVNGEQVVPLLLELTPLPKLVGRSGP